VATTTALVDLSNVCRGDTTPSWDRYLLLRQRLLDAGYTRVRAVADSSLRFRLPARDVGHLEAAIGRGEVQMTPYADPHLIAAALEDDTITLVTNDRFRALRGRFPALNGFTRVLAFRFHAQDVHLHDAPLEGIPDADISRAVEDETLSRLGYARPEDRELLQWDWRCPAPDCPTAVLPQLDELPRCDGGTATCPMCDSTLDRLGPAIGGLEIKLLVDDEVRERFALAVGTSRRLGRGAGPGRFDVSPMLDPTSASLVSRRHIEVTNHDGRLRVKELGSRNGTTVLRADGTASPLTPGTVLAVGVDDRVSLADAVTIQLSGRRWPRTRFLDTSVTTPPGETALGRTP
jgi:hypothetical protein